MKKLIVALILLTASTGQAAAPASLFVSILPQKFFVEKIAGDTVDVQVMVPIGANPVTYEPKPSQMSKLAKSKAYFSIGVPFEKSWLPRFSGVNPQLPIIATDHGIKKREMKGHHHHQAAQEKHHDHQDMHHGEEHTLDPHIWLSPELVKKQSQTITDKLCQLFPENSALYQKNLALFLREIIALQKEIKGQLGDSHLPFLVFHPSWGYFADEFHLEQEAIEVEGKSIKPKKLTEIITFCKSHGITTIFAQPQFSRKSAELIAKAIDGKVALLDPLAAEWDKNLLHAAQQLSKE